MIKVEDLKRIKKICFNNIARECGNLNKYHYVRFTPIENNLYEVLYWGGTNYAKLIAEVEGKENIPPFQISWDNFEKVCSLFSNIIEVKANDNMIQFSEGKTKFKCSCWREDITEIKLDFAFDFEKSNKINMDELFILKDFSSIGKYAIGGSYIVSTDGNFATANKLNFDMGDKVDLFVTKFPSGTWYYNPENKVIVSEDKSMWCSINRGIGQYPFKFIVDTSQRMFKYWLSVDAKRLSAAIDKCSLISNVITLNLYSDYITASVNGGTDLFETNINAEYNLMPERKFITLDYKYLKELLRCADDEGKLKIHFNDTEQLIKVENNNLCIFGMEIQKR